METKSKRRIIYTKLSKPILSLKELENLILSKRLKKSQTEQKDNLNLSMSSRKLAPIDPFNNKSINKNGFKTKTKFIYNYRNIHKISKLNIDINTILEFVFQSDA